MNQMPILNKINHDHLNLANTYKRDIDLLSEDISKLRIYSRPEKVKKRGLIDGLGSVVRYISGNLDQTDLVEIENNFHKINQNEEKLMTEISKLHTLAGQITQRWQSDLQKIQSYAENVYKDLTDLEDRLNSEIIIHIQLEQIRNLRNYIQTLLRTISFSNQGILNVELIKQQELQEIFNYLHSIHSHNEIATDIPTLLEITKINLIFTPKTMLCTLKVPLLANELYHLSKIIPIPSSHNNILIPPHAFALNSKGSTKWTNENCKKTFSFWYCQSPPHDDLCNLDDLSRCNFARASNNFSLFTQLSNGQTIICTRNPEDVNEDCSKSFKTIKVTNCNTAIGETNCMYSFQKYTWMGSNKTFSQEWPNFQEPKKIEYKVNIKPLHLDDPTKMIPQYEKPTLIPVEFHRRHFGVTMALIVIIALGATLFLFKQKLRNIFRRKPGPTATIEIPLEEQKLPSPLLTIKPEDVLQSRRGGVM